MEAIRLAFFMFVEGLYSDVDEVEQGESLWGIPPYSLAEGE